ncbi:hypothetical protein [Spongiimicrobium sp. 3-5]|uniref:hypothetical protein n=1 Tax=Spongiimicrobium sp. 3-5 TaxID=3332596 RepID=UPI00398153EC
MKDSFNYNNTEYDQHIQTQYVFAKDDQVYLRKNGTNTATDLSMADDDEWFPVNFQWIPVFELRKNLVETPII